MGGLAGLWDKYPVAVGKSVATIVINATTNATVVNNMTAAFNVTSNNGTGYTSACFTVEKDWDHMFRFVYLFYLFICYSSRVYLWCILREWF